MCVCVPNVCDRYMICHGHRTHAHIFRHTHTLVKGLNPVAAAPSTAAVVNIRSDFSTLFMAKAAERGVKGSRGKPECTSLMEEKGGVTT